MRARVACVRGGEPAVAPCPRDRLADRALELGRVKARGPRAIRVWYAPLGREPAGHVGGDRLGVAKRCPIETDQHGVPIKRASRRSATTASASSSGGTQGLRSSLEVLSSMKSLKSAFLRRTHATTSESSGIPLAVARVQHAVALGIQSARLNAADIELAELGPGQLGNRPPLADAEPPSVALTAQLGLEEEVVKDDDLAVAAELNIEFGAVEARGGRLVEGEKSVFRPELGAAPVGDIERPAWSGWPGWKSRSGCA